MTAQAMSRPAAAAERRAATRRPGTRVLLAWELRKLRAQKRTWIGLAAALLVPLLFVVALSADSGSTIDGVPLGGAIRESGLVVPLVGLAFGSIWFFPLIVSLVAGDVVAAEDGNGTLKTILTRSVDRGRVLAAKALAALLYGAGCLALYVGAGVVAGVLVWGLDPLPTLSGGTVSAGRGLLLVAGATAAYGMPILAIAAIGVLLSTVARNSAAAVVGTLMLMIVLQILGEISALDAIHPYLLTDQFDAWNGLLREPIDWAPIGHAAWVSALYALPALAGAWWSFTTRDVTGG